MQPTSSSCWIPAEFCADCLCVSRGHSNERLWPKTHHSEIEREDVWSACNMIVILDDTAGRAVDTPKANWSELKLRSKGSLIQPSCRW
jgi:hypothetical protein